MGLGAYKELLEALRTACPEAFWPKVERIASEAAANGTESPESLLQQIKLLWPNELRSIGWCIEDMCGTMRGIVLTTTLSAPASEEPLEIDPEDFEPIARPSILAEVIAKKFAREMAKRRSEVLHVVWDAIGRTPIIKGILAAKKVYRPVEFPEPPGALFLSDEPFRNDIHEIFADKQYESAAKKLLYDYITTALLDYYPARILEPSTRMVIWGGYYRGKPMHLPVEVAMDSDGGLLEPRELTCWPGMAEMPYAEADLTIVALVKAAMGVCHCKVNSRDNDFIPALCSVYIEKLREHISNEQVPDPRKTFVFQSRKIKASGKLPSASVGGSLSILPVAAPKKTKGGMPAFLAKPEGGLSGGGISLPTATGEDVSAPMREVMEIGSLAHTIWSIFYKAHKCKRCDPMAAFAALTYGSGSDYFKNPPYLSFTKLFEAYVDPDINRKVGCMFPLDDGPQPKRVRIDRKAFSTFLALAYCNSRNIPMSAVSDRSNIQAVRAYLKDVKERNASKRPPAKQPTREIDNLPPSQPENYAARLAWVATYYTKSHQAGFEHTSGLETVEVRDGIVASLYGYALKNGRAEFAEVAGVPVLNQEIF